MVGDSVRAVGSTCGPDGDAGSTMVSVLVPTTANKKRKPISPPEARRSVLSSARAVVVGSEAMPPTTDSGAIIAGVERSGTFVLSVETPIWKAVAVAKSNPRHSFIIVAEKISISGDLPKKESLTPPTVRFCARR